MVGSNKVKFIKENLKIHDFDYFSNSQDLPIWEYTKRAIHTNAPQKLIKTIKSKDFENKEIRKLYKNQMTLITFTQVFVVCLLGAMSPGPSIAVVINNAILKEDMLAF